MRSIHALLDHDVTLAFIRYGTILIVKMMLMSTVTAFFRMKKKAFANPEDTASFGKGENAKKYLRTDPDVERVRRIHLNDLENIIPFLFAGFFYSLVVCPSLLLCCTTEFFLVLGSSTPLLTWYLFPSPPEVWLGWLVT